MISYFIFINQHWFWQVWIAAVLIWGLFIWKEWRHFRSLKFYRNVSISLISILALACIALKPSITSLKETYNSILLTDGYNESQLDSLKKAHKRIDVSTYKNNSPILKESPDPRALFVLGNGIMPYDLWQLDSTNVTFFPTKPPPGIVRLKYDTNPTVGDRVLLNGLYNKAAKGHRLVLEGPGEVALDSVILTNETEQNFQLNADQNLSGQFVYYLTEKDSLGNRISTDPIPLSVSDRKSLKVLIVNEFPTFEAKYLKNFLADEGHQVTVKSELTKGRYKFEYFNTDLRRKIDFTKNSLSIFDLLIIDVSSLKRLSRKQRDILENSVREAGLGVFIQPETKTFNTTVPLSPFAFSSEKQRESALGTWPKIKIEKYPFHFKDNSQLQSIHILAKTINSAYKRLEAGRIGTSLFQNTFELLLNGHSKTYKQLWTETINKLSKREVLPIDWSSNAILGYQNEPFKFQLRTTILEPQVRSSNGYHIPLQQHMDLKTVWKGTSYPQDLGWVKLTMDQDSSEVLSTFITDATKWQALNAYNTIKLNQRYFSNSDISAQVRTKSKERINPLWFYIIFILCAGYLWLEPKL